MITVKATREGLIGQTTASGYVVDDVVPFVALPSKKALHKFLHVYRHSPNGSLLGSCTAIVLDIGPWNDDDDGYVFEGDRPQAESGTDTRGRTTNGAGIDLGEYVWKQLGMTDNGLVSWEFI
jgi:hypothetical protein